MANLIIKPTSGGSLILQDEGGTAAHTIDASGNHTLSGTTNNVGTVTAGSIAGGTITNATTFPAGHVIKQSFIGDQRANGHVGGTNTSYTDSGIEIAHVTADTSANSYLIYQWYCSMDHRGAAAVAAIDVTMRSTSTSTYSLNESIGPKHSYGCMYYEARAANTYEPKNLKLFCGLVSEMGMPTTKSSWAAGDTLYFRIFYKSSSGIFNLVHDDGTWNVSVTEVKR